MSNDVKTTSTSDVAHFITAKEFKDIPQAVVQTIKEAFIDTIGVAFAGRDEECVEILYDYVKQEGGAPHAMIWGKSGLLTSATLAALTNGTMAHALDYDDLNAKATHAHPSASLVPAIIAVAEEVNASGQDMITAYYKGFEVMAYVGREITYDHYKMGWHGTATIGVLGCVAASASLYNLTEAQTRHAIGIAVSHISGTRQNFGTMTKPFHAGKAAQSGITAAKLAARGFTASEETLESKMGFYQLYSPNKKPISTRIGERVELSDTKLTLKKYPCCYGSHRAIDAMQLLIEQHQLKPEHIQAIQVTGPLNAFTPLIHTFPQTGLEAKFSLEFPLSKLLVDGEISIASFEDDVVQQPIIQQLMTKFTRFEDPDIQIEMSGIDEGYVAVTVTLSNGEIIEQKVYDPKGSLANPLSTDEIVAKFLSCVQHVFPETEAQQFVDKLLQLESLTSIKMLQPYF